VRDEFRQQDVEFVTLTVKGQSFIMHHIRKMIGMTISVIRELQLRSTIQRSFENQRLDVPKAPGLGLILDRLHYDWYDGKYGTTHQKLTAWNDEIEEAMEKFKREVVLPEVFETEFTSQSMLQWLASLLHHTFIVDPEEEEPAGPGFVNLALAKVAEEMEEKQTEEEAAVEAKKEAPVPEEEAPVEEVEEPKKASQAASG